MENNEKIKNTIVLCKNRNELELLWKKLTDIGITVYYSGCSDNINDLYGSENYHENEPIYLNIGFGDYGSSDEKEFWFWYRMEDDMNNYANNWFNLPQIKYGYFFREEKLKRILEDK